MYVNYYTREIKYKLYLPTEEEFKKELNLDNYVKKKENESQNDVKI